MIKFKLKCMYTSIDLFRNNNRILRLVNRNKCK